MQRKRLLTWGLLSTLSVGGCYSGLHDGNAGADGASAADGDGGDDRGGGDDGDDDSGPDDESPVEAESRFPRLSHRQWENTVQDLLYLDAPLGLSRDFVDDSVTHGFDNTTAQFSVSSTLWGDYQRAAEAVADLVVGDPELLAGIMPADVPEAFEDKARAFVRHFGRRAFRRPLTEAEVESFTALFDLAPEMYEQADDAFNNGVHLTLQAMLQSPYFLYRIIRSEVVGDDGRIPLDGFERASKLSYALWNTMPDEALLDAAASGELDSLEGVRAQAERLLAHPRAEAAMADFHRQFLRLDKYRDLDKDSVLFPMFYPELGDAMVTEAQMFIRDVVFGQDETYTSLLTAPYTFVNEELAPLYGLEGEFGPEFERVELDTARRSGFLTRLGFLSANGTQVDPDPIHRGAFISFELMCNPMPPIPDNVSGVEHDPNKTNRERVDAHTGLGTCGAGCHSALINPPGFAFEHYDALGMWRSEDNGKPVNAADEFRFDGVPQPFEDAIEFTHLMADSHQAHACYVQHMLEYAYGRVHHAGDGPLIERLGTASRDEALSIRELVVELVTSENFLTHPAPEEN